MSRTQTIANALQHFDDGRFQALLSQRIARPTESQNPARAADLSDYLEQDLRPWLEQLGFSCQTLSHPAAKAPFLLAQRIEAANLPTVFGYGHGDVIRGLEKEWKPGTSPWALTELEGRWYGRGVADNKGQHTVNLQAMAHVIQTRGCLGFNTKYLIEMGEETGSPGLRELCAKYKDLFQADVMIASDGPRLRPDQPTVFMGTRGVTNFDLSIQARAGGHHSGNWGGLISNPGIQLAHAIASITTVNGQIRVREWVPKELPASVRQALANCEVDGGTDGPQVEAWWGEPGLSPAERVFGWSSFEVLAFKTGNPETPVNAIPPRAWARCQLRFVVGVDANDIVPALQRHLLAQGFSMVKVEAAEDIIMHATRVDPNDAWVRWVVASLGRTAQEQGNGKPVAVLPNLGGSLPNDIFTDTLGLKTIWVPHSYAGCSQHAPNEHLPKALLREAMALMTGLYWDLGEGETPKSGILAN